MRCDGRMGRLVLGCGGSGGGKYNGGGRGGREGERGC